MPYNYFPSYPTAYPQQYPIQPAMPDQLAQLRQGAQAAQYQAPVPARDVGIGTPIWVQGEAGARGYLVAAGNTVLLMDSESPVFYLKSVDVNNIPQPLRVFDYTERSTTPVAPVAAQPEVEYATREELRALERRVEGMASVEKEPPKSKKTVKEGAEDA